MHVTRVTSEAAQETAFAIRRQVFVQEQQVDPAIEYDEYDATATHFLAYQDPQATSAVGTARVVITGAEAKLGRMAVLPEMRGRGVGRALTDAALQYLAGQGVTEIILHAQTHAEEFYAKMGFLAEGDIFEEAGIPHRCMRRTL